jgi:hypothetical protein
MKVEEFTNEFVEFIPEVLQDGVLYCSMKYGTLIHNCACGCGLKTVTPLSPSGWFLRSDGDTVTLEPSISNYQYPCKSHYFIRNNKVVWA